MNFSPGSKIGDYEVIEPLGAGGMGLVYKVRNELSDRVEAMKVLLPDLAGQTDLATRFLREIKTQAGLDHPGIAKLYTAARIDNQLLMFMEFVDGIALDRRLKQGPIPINDVISYMVQALWALDYAHKNGVVHRDMKPANIMLTPNGRIKLLDFGIAKVSVESRLTVAGSALGSIYYMSPEQIQGAKVDGRSDLYSLGVSLYELVTRKRPFEGETQYAVMMAHLAKEAVPAKQLNPELPAVLDEIILRALSKDVETRFQNAGEFVTALRNVQTASGPGESIPPAPPVLSPPPALRRSMAPTGPTATAAPRPIPPAPSSAEAGTESISPLPVFPPSFISPPPQASDPQSAPALAWWSNRLLWVAAGAVCVLLGAVAFIQSGPHQETNTKVTPPPATKQQQTTPSPAVRTEKPTPKKAQPETQARSTPAQDVPRPPQRPPEQPAPSRPTRSQPAPPDADKTKLDNELPSEVNRGRMVVAGLGQQLDMLVVRASTLRVTISGLQRGQTPPASLGDWIDALNSINGLLRRATAAVDKGDAATARGEIQKAAVQIDSLEKALGK